MSFCNHAICRFCHFVGILDAGLCHFVEAVWYFPVQRARGDRPTVGHDKRGRQCAAKMAALHTAATSAATPAQLAIPACQIVGWLSYCCVRFRWEARMVTRHLTLRSAPEGTKFPVRRPEFTV